MMKKLKKKRSNKAVYLAIPLGRAKMCLTCEVIINSRHRACPRCTGTHFASLGNWAKPLCPADEFVAA